VDTFGRATLRGAKLNEGTTEVQSSELQRLSSANGYISASLNSESTSCLYRIGLPALRLAKKRAPLKALESNPTVMPCINSSFELLLETAERPGARRLPMKACRCAPFG
jgi:hypothetical protein